MTDEAAQDPRFRDDVTVELVRHAARDGDVLWAARVSTAGEQSLEELQKDPERSKGLINYLMRDRHGTPFEHNSMTFFVSAPIFVFREFHRHRSGWCLAGDAEITLESEDGPPARRSIKELYRLWHHGAEDRLPVSAGGVTWHAVAGKWRAEVRHQGETRHLGLHQEREDAERAVEAFRAEHPGTRLREPDSVRRSHVRCYDEQTLLAERAQIVDVMESGVRQLLRLTTASGKALRCSKDHAVLTPDGWRKAGELQAGDAVMVGGAAPAAGPDVLLTVEDDGEEMTYDLSVEGPWHNFLADGVVVHNSYNEESGRYRELQPVFYVPGEHRKLVQQGRPGHYEFVEGTAEQHDTVTTAMEDSYRRSYEAYQEMLAAGVAREVARAVLPVGLFSSMYATCNARSLMHFLSLRTKDDRAKVPSFPQREIEMVAERMEQQWAELMPLTHAAFNAHGRVAP